MKGEQNEGREINIRMRIARPTVKTSLSRHREARVPSWYLLGTLRVLKPDMCTGAGVSPCHALVEVIHPHTLDLAIDLQQNG